MKRTLLLLAVLLGTSWLVFPAVVAADNCQNMGADERDRECSIPEKVFGFFTGLAIMAGLASKYHNPKTDKKNQLSQWGHPAVPKAPPKAPDNGFKWSDPGTWF